jgi:hypothetical protein
MGRDAAARRQVAPRFKLQENKSRGAGRQLVAMKQPPAGSVLEPAHPETAGDTPRSLTSSSNTVQLEERSRDFDGCEPTLARNRTRRSPMLSHETSPVLGASVMGMTIGVGQGQSHLPADVSGITATSGQRGRLHPKGRLLAQPAGNFITRGPSRRRRRKPSSGRFIKSSVAPTRSTEAGDQRDASHAQPHQPQLASPSSTKGSEADRRHMLRICWSKGKRRFIKRHAPRQRARGWRGPRQDRSHEGASSQTLNYNQAPTYIRGPGPLE